MSLTYLHAVATVLATLAFFAVCWWAYSPVNRQRFEQDGDIVLETDPIYGQSASTTIASSEKPL